MSVAWVGVGVAAAGALSQRNAAKKAANAQQAGADQANDTQRYIFDQSRADQLKQYEQQRKDQLPFITRGNEAGNRLQYLLGLSPTGMGLDGAKNDPLSKGNLLTRDQLREELMGKYTNTGADEWVLARPGEGVEQNPVWRNRQTGELSEGYRPVPNGKLLSDYSTTAEAINDGWSPGGTDNPSFVDYDGLNREIEDRLAKQTTDKAAQDQMMRTQSIEAQTTAQNDPAYGSLLRNFGQQDLDNDLVYQNGLQFGLNEGVKGVNRMAAATGSQLSGATLKALTRFGNDYATTKTGGAYDRFNNNRQQTYNMLAGVAGTGQVATNQMGAAGQNMVNQNGAIGFRTGAGIAENQLAMGNARGASAIAQGNSLTGALGGAYNAWQRSQLATPSYNPYSDPTYGTGNRYSGFNAANGGWGIE
jgi:hypothetical protein